MKPPVDTTISRALAGCSLEELQNAFSEFLQTLLAEAGDPITAAIDGKTSCQFYDADYWQIENSLHFAKDRWWDEIVTLAAQDRHY